MAAFAGVSIYGANGNDWNTPQGTRMAFHATTIVVREIAPTAYSGVTCVSQIQLLPSGPSTIQPVYYTARTVAQLVTDFA